MALLPRYLVKCEKVTFFDTSYFSSNSIKFIVWKQWSTHPIS